MSLPKKTLSVPESAMARTVRRNKLAARNLRSFQIMDSMTSKIVNDQDIWNYCWSETFSSVEMAPVTEVAIQLSAAGYVVNTTKEGDKFVLTVSLDMSPTD